MMGANSEPGTVILLCQLMENVAKFKKMSEILLQKLSYMVKKSAFFCVPSATLLYAYKSDSGEE